MCDAEFCEGEIMYLPVLPPVLEFAVIQVDTCSRVETKNTEGNTIDFDPILVTEEMFKYLFYHCSSTFSVNPAAAACAKTLALISFDRQYVKCEPFNLLEAVIQNIENTMNCNRTMFSQRSTIKLYAEIASLHTVLDMHLKEATTSLNWEQLKTVAQSFYIRTCSDPRAVRPFILTLSVIILVPGVPPLTIRFNYETEINIIAD